MCHWLVVVVIEPILMTSIVRCSEYSKQNRKWVAVAVGGSHRCFCFCRWLSALTSPCFPLPGLSAVVCLHYWLPLASGEWRTPWADYERSLLLPLLFVGCLVTNWSPGCPLPHRPLLSRSVMQPVVVAVVAVFLSENPFQCLHLTNNAATRR